MFETLRNSIQSKFVAFGILDTGFKCGGDSEIIMSVITVYLTWLLSMNEVVNCSQKPMKATAVLSCCALC